MNAYPVFEFLPFETIIKDRQEEYYAVLEQSDKQGKSTTFIEFILTAINESLAELLQFQNRSTSAKDRVAYFISVFRATTFSRKDYLTIFKDISPATASRDLKYGVVNGLLVKEGDKRLTRYSFGRLMNKM